MALRNASIFPGVAKFGIALEWGSRGLEFESRHSDQKTEATVVVSVFFYSNNRFEQLNAARMSAAADGLTEANINLRKYADASESRHSDQKSRTALLFCFFIY